MGSVDKPLDVVVVELSKYVAHDNTDILANELVAVIPEVVIDEVVGVQDGPDGVLVPRDGDIGSPGIIVILGVEQLLVILVAPAVQQYGFDLLYLLDIDPLLISDCQQKVAVDSQQLDTVLVDPAYLLILCAHLFL